MPLVSIICSVKNGGELLSQTIESVIDQSITDWEFIIVDDGSVDNTPEVIKSYNRRDKRIIFLPTNGIGRGKALNLAIDTAKGDYIANIDADDPIHPKRLEIQFKLIKDSEYSLLSSNYLIIRDSEKPIWENSFNDINNLDITFLNEKLPYQNPINHSSVLMNKSDLIKIGKYNVNITSQFDYELWIRFAKNNLKMGKIPLTLCSKRIHHNQSFENKKRIKYLINSMNVQRKAIKDLKGPLSASLLMYLRFFYGLLPQRLRVKLKNKKY
ncbi:glycosyltransferase family 2 protein [Peribacillus frigoritolerans]|uniref:glycosyltransferase family 2 protein n=1 Tax=Peribacillus frigoritolerans TaxID=450367 RepID=UPI003D00AFC4